MFSLFFFFLLAFWAPKFVLWYRYTGIKNPVDTSLHNIYFWHRKANNFIPYANGVIQRFIFPMVLPFYYWSYFVNSYPLLGMKEYDFHHFFVNFLMSFLKNAPVKSYGWRSNPQSKCVWFFIMSTWQIGSCSKSKGTAIFIKSLLHFPGSSLLRLLLLPIFTFFQELWQLRCIFFSYNIIRTIGCPNKR